MMTELPDPLVPADVDLTDFKFMPMEINRLLDSQFNAHATDAEWRAGVILWMKSYHQVPAASLPDDDIALAKLVGLSPTKWRGVKKGAMRGWILCNDQRWYHPVVAEKALEAWPKKTTRATRAVAGASARWAGIDPDQRTRSQRVAEARKLGRHTALEWQAMLEIFGNACVCCGASDVPIVKGHVVPFSKKGSDSIKNLQPFCEKCSAGQTGEIVDHRENALVNWELALHQRIADLSKTPQKRVQTPAKGQGQGIEKEESIAAPMGFSVLGDAPPDPKKTAATMLIAVFDEERTAAYGEGFKRGWPSAIDMTIALRWVDAGVSIEMARAVMAPIFARKAATAPANPPGSLSYFADAMTRAAQDAARVGPVVISDPAYACPKYRDPDWPKLWSYVEIYRKKGKWYKDLGPKPGEAGCTIPLQILIDCGFASPAPAAGAQP